eukprot:12929266-Prorocentrum_lima.AAC.1
MARSSEAHGFPLQRLSLHGGSEASGLSHGLNPRLLFSVNAPGRIKAMSRGNGAHVSYYTVS